MWRLQPEAGGEPYRFLTGVEYVVGRKNCAILIQDDQSISRAHATFTVDHPPSNLNRETSLPILTVKDTSKYGTFVNEEKLQNDSPKVLKSGDKVTCGVFQSKFRVEYEPLVTCSSCLDGSGKSALNQAVLKLGGHVVNNWTEECTHLVMNSVKVTIKTICALICLRPVLKPEYFSELIKAIQTKQPLPKPESFYPPVDEPSISSEQFDLSGRPERRRLFRRKTFLFLNAKQHKKLSSAIVLGGGEAKLFPEGSMETSLLDSPGTCVIDAGCTSSQLSICDSTRKWIDSTIAVLQSKGLRAIPESEIGLAVIFMSTETYCNPQSHPTEESTAASRATIAGPTLSQSMAVDETIMPAPTFNTTAYVVNTEPQDQPDTWLEVSGVQEVKETPKVERRGKLNIQNISTVKESPSAVSIGKTATSLFRKETRTEEEQKSQQLLQPTVPRVGKTKDKASQQQSQLMKSYFQVTSKKRERDDEEEEMSIPKLAKTDQKSLNLSDEAQVVTTPLWGKKIHEQSQNKGFATDSTSSSLSEESSEKCGLGNGKGYNETVRKMSTGDNPPPNKRKECDDLFPGAEQFEERKVSKHKADKGDQIQNDEISIRKKRRLEAEDKIVKEEDISIVTDICRAESIPTLKRESDLKMELSVSVRKQSNNTEKLEEDSDTLPSRLLLTEFKSLVVSNLTRKSNFRERKDDGNTLNYKKFKKVSYPGAGGFPHIIGGSDLIAYNTKKNLELEMWFRDEREEQTQHAREESLADDLFRYNPKAGKKKK